MPGYCGICNRHYTESGFEHDDLCEGREPMSIEEKMFNEREFQLGNGWANTDNPFNL